MSANCYVRTVVAKSRVSAFWGQYDLRIEGTVNFKGKNIVNPIYSYRTDSKLYIFSSTKQAENCKYKNSTTEGWEWKFTVSDSKLSSFASKINSAVQSYTWDATKQCLTCTMASSNGFSSYKLGSTDCFSATATWCNWLGNNTLLNIFNDANNYKAYEAWSLRPKYYEELGLWVKMPNASTM